ncbi:stalk domain-containing protein [Peptococcaceae bacterium 1198_IL3148]
MRKPIIVALVIALMLLATPVFADEIIPGNGGEIIVTDPGRPFPGYEQTTPMPTAPVISSNGISIIVDSQPLDVSTASENGTTLVPLRAIFQSLGAEVNWDGPTQTVNAVKGQTTIKLQIGSKTAYKNGQAVALQVPGKVVNGNTMVPLRFVSESLGANVVWDGASQTITITSTGTAPITSPTTPATEITKVHFIDVGQADSIYIEMPNNQDVLIDGGNRADSFLVVDYLKKQGVDDIELLVATHPHEDHIGGLPAVLDAFKVEQIIDSGHFTDSKISTEYRAKAQAEGAECIADSHQSFAFGNVALQVLTGSETWKDVNDYSVVCRLDTGNIEFMFTGDAEEPVEKILKGELEAEVLKVGHHGSDSSTSDAFLNKVAPKTAIISVGAGNSYGHPTVETLQKLNNANIKIYRTDLNGHIVVITDGKTYSVATQYNRTAPVVQPAPVQTKPVPIVTPKPEPTPQVPAVTTGQFVGSAESDKYHEPGCRYAEKITAENKVWFKDAADAQAQGYAPCGVCKP